MYVAPALWIVTSPAADRHPPSPLTHAGLEEKMFTLGLEQAEAAVCEPVCEGQAWEAPSAPPPAPPAGKKKKTKKTKKTKKIDSEEL
jgi:hypothetical protein